MNLNQTIQCPVCNGPINFNVQALISGASFECRDCKAVIKISPSSMNQVKQVYENFINLKDKKAKKVDTFSISEFLEVVDKV